MNKYIVVLLLAVLGLGSCNIGIYGDDENIGAETNSSSSDKQLIDEMLDGSDDSELSNDEKLKARLTDIQYKVTQKAATEKPYENAYWDLYDEGIYVDIIDGTPLFSSTTKFKSNTGWPSFTAPISEDNIRKVEDNLLWYTRVEVRGEESDSHLGHIFTDGPKAEGGLRYCINSASLFFIAKDDMEELGYGDYLYLFDE